jgi:hypothetical protein
MNETILSGPVDITDRVHALGWRTAGLTVRAYTIADEDSSPLGEDCYTDTQKSAWRRDEWCYVGVIVTVTDAQGFEWGSDSLFGVEAGTWTDTDESDTVTGTRTLDPLTNPDHPLPTMIPEAMANAAKRIASFALPQIQGPA